MIKRLVVLWVLGWVTLVPFLAGCSYASLRQRMAAPGTPAGGPV